MMARVLSTLLPLMISTTCAAQDANVFRHWSATSNTATSITGPLTIKPGQLIIDNRIHLLMDKTPQQLSQFGLFVPLPAAVVKQWHVPTSVVAAAYRLHGETRTKLENNNVLCGMQKSARWMIFWFGNTEKTSLSVTFSASETLPTHQLQAEDCGSFGYARGDARLA